MKCPACREMLLTIEVDGVELDFCAIDDGVWVDEGEIEALFRASGPVLKSTDGKPGKRRCPRCDGKLNVQAVADLEVDVCPRGDGVWFDAGELPKLYASFAGSERADFKQVFTKLNAILGD